VVAGVARGGDPITTNHPTFHVLKPLGEGEVLRGEVKLCDHCREEQIFGNAYAIRIAWRHYELCAPCVLDLVNSMKQAIS
jgi:hypothetical protein